MSGGQIVAPLADFVPQRLDGADWKDISGTSAQDNADPQWSGTFAPVTAANMRLCVTRTSGDISRIWEIELYGPVK